MSPATKVELKPGAYKIKAYVDSNHRIEKDPGALLGEEEFQGEMQVSAQWNVVVFPSTFVIAPDGKIVYGVKGGIHWDAPEIMEQINALLKESQD